ncbi:tol-pal system protein YbgF [Desulfatibacillum aliphaticivorans]|uniref:Tol-pal system protein YbgF n=1 Tax=Desulfatibacillum aliphaticivorans TaxID=218208 RepID=B8FK10_DESAL|nr:tol-pal system protein YbgF [Desulfatibacillum aliphaticivorans]ACL02685.1 tol-pal system protein YbgF [Desulfatibacillum aliphaticivorans]
MHMSTVVKIMTKTCFVVALAFTLAGCSWFDWLKQDNTDPRLEDAHKKLDAIATNTDIAEQQLHSVNKRLSAIEQRLLNMEGQMGNMSIMMESISLAPSEIQQQAGYSQDVEDDYLTAPEVQKPPAPAPEPPKTASSSLISPEEQYAGAYLHYQNREQDKAIRAFKAFLADNPDHDLADNAQYWIGEAYYDQKMYPEAIEAFKQVVKKYPDQNKAPAALLKIGYSYLAVDNPEQASKFLRQVVTDYPFSDLVNKAQNKLSDLQPAKPVSDAFPNGGS